MADWLTSIAMTEAIKKAPRGTRFALHMWFPCQRPDGEIMYDGASHIISVTKKQALSWAKEALTDTMDGYRLRLTVHVRENITRDGIRTTYYLG